MSSWEREKYTQMAEWEVPGLLHVICRTHITRIFSIWGEARGSCAKISCTNAYQVCTNNNRTFLQTRLIEGDGKVSAFYGPDYLMTHTHKRWNCGAVQKIGLKTSSNTKVDVLGSISLQWWEMSLCRCTWKMYMIHRLLASKICKT